MVLRYLHKLSKLLMSHFRFLLTNHFFRRVDYLTDPLGTRAAGQVPGSLSTFGILSQHLRRRIMYKPKEPRAEVRNDQSADVGCLAIFVVLILAGVYFGIQMLEVLLLLYGMVH